MYMNDDDPEDVKRAVSIEKEINKGERDDKFEGYPRFDKKKEKWLRCVKPSAKKKAQKSVAESECCERKKGAIATKKKKQITVMIYGKPCIFPKLDTIPRHCLSKKEYIDMLATPSRRCPPACLQEAAIRKLKPVSQRIKELARPPKHRMLMTLQEGASRLKPEFVDNLIKSLEDETCLTPEKAAKAFRDKKRQRISRRREKERKFNRLTRIAKKPPGIPSATIFDKDAVTCQYMMAESFVKSILDWKCPIPKEEYEDIANVIIKRLSYVLEYTPLDESDRKSQQMRFLSDVIACWISGVLFEVAADHKKELEEVCERKRKEAEEEEEEEEVEEVIRRKKRDEDEDDEEEEEAEEEAEEEEKEEGGKEEEEKEYDGTDEEAQERVQQEERRKMEEEEKGRKEEEAILERERQEVEERKRIEEEARIQKEKEEEEARLQKEKEEEEEEARLQKEKEEEEEEARLQKEKEEEEEARLQKEKEEEEEARLQKVKEEEEARLQKKKEEEEEEARLQKEKEEEEEARLQKEKEEEEEKARLQKEKEEEEEKARLQKEKEEEEEVARLQKEKEEEEEEARLQKEKEEEEEARLQKEKEEEEEARLQKEKEKEEEEARLQKEKEKEEEEARLQKEKEKEEEEARLQKEKEKEDEEARLQKEKEEEEEEARLQKEKEVEEARLQKEKEEDEKRRETEEEEKAKREVERMESIVKHGDYGDLFFTDVPFVTFSKMIDVLYAMLESMPESKGVDLIRDRIQAAIYDKFRTVIELEDPEALNEHMKDVLIVLAGKIANWLKNILTESQIIFLDKYPAEVESVEIRDWSKWLTYVSDTADNWATWLRKVLEEAEGINEEGITRGDWQDWTKSVDVDALLWRRFHLQTIHQAHRNVTLMAQREVVKTGTKTMNFPEKEIRNADLQIVA